MSSVKWPILTFSNIFTLQCTITFSHEFDIRTRFTEDFTEDPPYFPGCRLYRNLVHSGA